MAKKGLLLVLAAACVMLFAPAAMAEEGVTDTEIHIGQWGPQTGPAAPWGAVARGSGVLFDMINEQGGINGRKIVYHMFDDGYNPARTKAGVKELQEGVGIFAWGGGVGTACGLAVRDYLMDRGVPWVGPSSGSLHWVSPPFERLFAVYPLYYKEAKALSRYSVDILGKKKVAIVYQNDDYGMNGKRGAEEELAAHGMELVASIPVEKSDSDMKPHVMQLRKSGADAVLLWVTPTHAVKIIGTSKAMQFETQWLSTSTCSDFPLMYKISKGLWEGVIATNFIEPPDSRNPLMRIYKNAYEKFAAKDERWGVFFYAGMGFVEPLVAGIEACGRDLTRERFVEEMEKMQNFRGVMGRISYSPYDKDNMNCRQGQQEMFISRCGPNGASIRLTDWIEIK
ncbi:MAG: ABC transporter substrate-binding protein [Desulfatibacillaceae bacterium]